MDARPVHYVTIILTALAGYAWFLALESFELYAFLTIACAIVGCWHD